MDNTTYTDNGIFIAENTFMIHHMVPLVIESKFVTVAFFFFFFGQCLRSIWRKCGPRLEEKKKITAGGFLYHARPLLPLSY